MPMPDMMECGQYLVLEAGDPTYILVCQRVYEFRFTPSEISLPLEHLDGSFDFALL